MDFGFSEDQEMLRQSARDFLGKECPMTLVRKLMEDESGHSPELWKKMADLGWLGLILPEEYGGLGLGVGVDHNPRGGRQRSHGPGVE